MVSQPLELSPGQVAYEARRIRSRIRRALLIVQSSGEDGVTLRTLARRLDLRPSDVFDLHARLVERSLVKTLEWNGRIVLTRAGSRRIS